MELSAGIFVSLFLENSVIILSRSLVLLFIFHCLVINKDKFELSKVNETKELLHCGWVDLLISLLVRLEGIKEPFHLLIGELLLQLNVNLFIHDHHIRLMNLRMLKLVLLKILKSIIVCLVEVTLGYKEFW